MANEDANVGTGAMLAESVAIFQRNWPLLLVAGGFEGLAQFGQKIENRERLAGLAGVILATAVVTVTQMLVQGVIARSVFVREGIVDATVPARFGAYMGVSILVLLGIMLGSVLLIVPGIMLGLRWALAANFTLTREMGIREAMDASRETTDGHRGEIFGAYMVFGLVAYAPYLVLVPIAGGFEAMTLVDPWSLLGAIRVAWSVLMAMGGLALGIGMFSVLAGRNDHLHEVFA